jgi:hypothetical protein
MGFTGIEDLSATGPRAVGERRRASGKELAGGSASGDERPAKDDEGRRAPTPPQRRADEGRT